MFRQVHTVLFITCNIQALQAPKDLLPHSSNPEKGWGNELYWQHTYNPQVDNFRIQLHFKEKQATVRNLLTVQNNKGSWVMIKTYVHVSAELHGMCWNPRGRYDVLMRQQRKCYCEIMSSINNIWWNLPRWHSHIPLEKCFLWGYLSLNWLILRN